MAVFAKPAAAGSGLVGPWGSHPRLNGERMPTAACLSAECAE